MTKKKPAPRGRRPLPETERKDRLVQTRVPEDLDSALREQARKSRVSVSQLIRNVLEDTFNLVDNVVAEATQLGQTVKRDAQRIAASAKGRPATPPGEGRVVGVYAWQAVVLNRDTRCARCDRPLRKGTEAQIGLHESGSGPRIVVCTDCAAKL